jgi:hypothetical protein
MSRIRLLVVAAALLVVGLASVAQGSDGQALMLGTANTSMSDTTLQAGGDANGLVVSSTQDALEGKSTSEGSGVSGVGENGGTGVSALGIHGAEAFGATGHSSFNGGVTFLNGSVAFDTTSGVAVVPAGSNRVTVSVVGSAFDRQSHALAMLQQRRSAEVAAVRPNRAAHTISIFLSKEVGLDTKVAWFLFD